jgi:hypothetical protein
MGPFPGKVCDNFALERISLFLGNRLNLAVDPKYPNWGQFRVRQPTIEAVAAVIET